MFVRTQEGSRFINLDHILEVFVKGNLIFAKPVKQGDDDILLGSYGDDEAAKREAHHLMMDKARYDSDSNRKMYYAMPED